MKIIHLQYVEEREEWRDEDHYTHSTIDWSEIQLPGATCIIYVYATAPYEGTGHALIKFGCQGWAYAYLGHCSCYGPLDRVPTEPQARTLAALTAGWTAEALRERAAVLAAAEGRP